MYVKGVLLINLGTPEAPTRCAVFRYLTEFLLDPRVIDMHWLKRQCLVRGLIIPSRLKSSTKSYQKIWTSEGSPLLAHGKRAAALLQERLGENYVVELAMRYQIPSIASALKKLIKQGVDELLIFPLFPQYASATTGSIFEKTFKTLKNYSNIPKVKTIHSFANHPDFINALTATVSNFNLNEYDHIVMSFHGLPVKQILKADPYQDCLKEDNCCTSFTKRSYCYSAQCFATAHALADKLNLLPSSFTICFQSRLGKDPWLKPFTSDILLNLAKKGAKRVLVFTPAFVADCLETIYEIGIEYRELFLHAGGERLDLVPCVNDHPDWIDALENMVKMA